MHTLKNKATEKQTTIRSIYLNTKPVSINKRYTIARGRNILSTEYRNAKQELEWEIKSQWKYLPSDEEDISLNIIIYYSGRKADIDAYIKILLDAMEGIVYSNDGLVSELHVFRKKVKKDPQIIIQIL